VSAQPAWVKRFEITISILTALVTILSAVIAWQAAIDSDTAGNADFAGIGAALSREETRILDSETTYQQYRAYTSYLRNNEVGNTIADDLSDDQKTFTDEQLASMRIERNSSWNQTLVDQDFFDTRYLRSDGTYDTQRQLSESEAEAAQQKDIDPLPHFTLADRLRAKSNLMVGMLIIMAGALWFYTMANEIKHPIRYGLAALGVICMLMGMIGAISIKVIS
jgi:hypothetical protein